MLSTAMQEVLSRNGHFGWIPPSLRTLAQNDAHAASLAHSLFYRSLDRAGLPTAPPPKGAKVILTDAWKSPIVIADVGYEFTGFRQLTGSCVGVSTGNAVFTLSAIQRLLAANPTKAFVPWWPYNYGTCRSNEGDRGQGEGAVDSVMFKTIMSGVLPYDQATGVPTYDHSDGLAISSHDEMTYSDGMYSGNMKFISVAKQFPLGSAAVCQSTDDMAIAICNGYPILDGCDEYIGNGSVGSDGVCLGEYDGRGGHSTCYLGYWDHPNLGPLFLYSNQWSGNTYPQDNTGKGRCTTWIKEAKAAKLFSLGGSGGETAALSHLSYFPAQPAVIDLDTWM